MHEQLLDFLFTAHYQGHSQSTRSLPISGSALPIQFLGENKEKHGAGDDCRDSAGILELIAASSGLLEPRG
jgi:hypothetical protein